MMYDYTCDNCSYVWEESYPLEYRDFPIALPCPRCYEYSVRRVISPSRINIPEGAYGNAANGYSTTHGDAENFKARSRGEAPPYPKDKNG